MAIGFPSGTNTYIPNHAASQMLIVGYSRSIGTFKIPSYTQYIMSKDPTGLYMKWNSRQAARIITDGDDEHNWPDGAAAPVGVNNLEGWEWQFYQTNRKAYAFTMGALAVDNASFPLLAQEAAVCAGQAMVARTVMTQTALARPKM